jgi:hypothetical protein
MSDPLRVRLLLITGQLRFWRARPCIRGRLRASGYGEGDLFTIQGSMIPFAATETERQRAEDPRPSLETRYATRDAWAARLAEATDQLVTERLLLAEDRDRLVAAAREPWDVYQAL